jgi:hypothetical protein
LSNSAGLLLNSKDGALKVLDQETSGLVLDLWGSDFWPQVSHIIIILAVKCKRKGKKERKARRREGRRKRKKKRQHLLSSHWGHFTNATPFIHCDKSGRQVLLFLSYT